jgi:peptidoglycan/xylan/chitin deacetylase (PgdA/CDA1 family)
LWDQIAALIDAGTLVSPDEVLLELERGGDDLYDWAKERPTLFRPPTQSVQARVAYVVNTFPTFVPERAPDGIWADPYVVALAQEVGAAVVTSELIAPPNAHQIKIPNVCEALGTRCLTLLGFFRERGWRF